MFKNWTKEQRLKWWTEVINGVSCWHDLPLEWINSYQARITLPEAKHLHGYRLDYFPISGRATKVGSNVWFQIKDIELWIENHMQGINKRCKLLNHTYHDNTTERES